MRLTFGKTEVQTPYCKSVPCTCGQNCHEGTGTHKRITGALTFDEYSEETPCELPTEIDDDQYEYALALLGVK